MLPTLANVQPFLAKWFFPAMVVDMVIGCQLWKFGPFLVGQMLSWVVDVAAILIVLKAFRRNLLPPILLAWCILSAKMIEVVFANATAGLVYIICLNTLFCLAGAVIASQYPNLVYKQVMIICLLNVLLMVLQVTGVGTWTQFLATEGSKEVVSTLFVQEKALTFWVVQGRPSGFLHSNNFLSLLVLFGFALHLSRIRNKFWWGTLILCSMAVLSMARIVFLGFLIIGMVLIVVDNYRHRRSFMKALTLMIFLFGIYIFLFPGLFANTFSRLAVTYSIFIRITDILVTLPQGSILHTIFGYYFGDISQAYMSSLGPGHVSGYSYLIPLLPYLMMLLLIVTPFYFRGLHRLRMRLPHMVLTIKLTLVVLIVYIAAVPFLKAQLYWFMAGFALLPLFAVLMPRFFKRVSGCAQAESCSVMTCYFEAR